MIAARFTLLHKACQGIASLCSLLRARVSGIPFPALWCFARPRGGTKVTLNLHFLGWPALSFNPGCLNIRWLYSKPLSFIPLIAL